MVFGFCCSRFDVLYWPAEEILSLVVEQLLARPSSRARRDSAPAPAPAPVPAPAN